VGAAVEAGIRAGRPHSIAVTALAPVRVAPPVAGARAVLALVPEGPAAGGVAELFGAEGVQVLGVPVPPDPDDTGVAAEVQAAVRAAVLDAGAAEVVLLPDHPALVGPAGRAAVQARGEGRDVAVVPTRSPVQGLAAVAVADAGLRFSDDVIAMTEAASATRWAEVVVAEHEALTSAGRCHPGEALGLVEGDVVVVGPALLAVTFELLDRLLAGGGELVTLVGGRLAEAAAAHLAARHPTVEVAVHPLGPGARALLVGVE
jgi:dihydroxyacetone kinase-like predicted kinase